MIASDISTPQWPFSTHARRRVRQRSIPPRAQALILSHGIEEPAPGGARRIRLDRAGLAELEAEYGAAAIRPIARKLRAYAVVGADGRVVTFAWPRG
jgi:hypothetical protein